MECGISEKEYLHHQTFAKDYSTYSKSSSDRESVITEIPATSFFAPKKRNICKSAPISEPSQVKLRDSFCMQFQNTNTVT